MNVAYPCWCTVLKGSQNICIDVTLGAKGLPKSTSLLSAECLKARLPFEWR